MKIVTVLCFVIVSYCGTAQHQEIMPKKGQQFLVGPITLENLQKEPYNSWFLPNYNTYQVDTTIAKILQKKLEGYELKLFLGTWCGDSKREVPRMVKLIEKAKFPIEELELITLDKRGDMYKKSPGGEEKGWNIIKIPTLIVLKEGREINRIVESPVDSLEEDLLAILTNQGYVPHYSSN